MHFFSQFRMQLSRALAEAANSFDIVGSDHRIGPLLKVEKMLLLCVLFSPPIAKCYFLFQSFQFCYSHLVTCLSV